MNPPGPALGGAASLFYAGRRRDVEAPPGWLQLSSWDVLPFRLGVLLDEAPQLIVLDPMSFPFDSMRDSDRDIPLVVQLPDGWDADALIALLNQPLFAGMTVFDRISLADEETWLALRSRYSWPDTVRVSSPLEPGPGTRRQKSVHRLLRRAIARQLRAAYNAIPVGEMLGALVLADDPDEWRTVVTSTPASVSTEVAADGAAERVHASLSITALCDRRPEQRLELLSELVSALRVGGRLIVVDRFLDGAKGQTIGAPKPRELMSEVHRSAARNVVLQHVEALRIRGEALTSIGLFAFTKLGRPERM